MMKRSVCTVPGVPWRSQKTWPGWRHRWGRAPRMWHRSAVGRTGPGTWTAARRIRYESTATTPRHKQRQHPSPKSHAVFSLDWVLTELTLSQPWRSYKGETQSVISHITVTPIMGYNDVHIFILQVSGKYTFLELSGSLELFWPWPWQGGWTDLDMGNLDRP